MLQINSRELHLGHHVAWSDLDYYHMPPFELVIFLGALVTPTVVLGFLVLRSVWLTYASLYYLWVVAPSAVCFTWSGARARVRTGLRQGRRNFRRQLCLVLPLDVLVVGTSLYGYHLLAEPVLGLDMGMLRATLAQFGLTPSNPAGDLGALAWLTLLNPLMEEGFWRLFLFQMLLPRRRPPASPRPPVGGGVACGGTGCSCSGGGEEGALVGSSDEHSDDHSGVHSGAQSGIDECGGGGQAIDNAESSAESGLFASVCAWWGPCLLTSCLYASYHVPVVWSFLPLPLCAAAFLGLVGLGVLLQLIVERVGLVLAVGVHLAYDLCASLIIADVLFGWGLALPEQSESHY